jgi:protease-4
MAIIEDSSGRAEAMGIKVHIIASGAHKGDLAPGTKITDDQLKAVQERVNDINEHFLDAVANGRGQGRDYVEQAWASGKVYIADKAKTLGLIDDVGSFDAAYGALLERVRPIRSAHGRLRSQAAKQLIDSVE